ncbi:MAG: hypothetical protein R6U67_01295 [Sodalinema sp.]|uniref:hypothetical protein n=1 Tax=Sodalinema sp. TaxID=3080550 RepID=UPI0007C29595|nr:hypothetical protein AY600_00270 [Phormidium willei BDU 130791]TAN95778.1 MAG: hypothetical protein EYR95_12985 [Phormidium sp. SL48-SHIP]
MTLQEILKAVDDLSLDEQTVLLNVLQVKLSETVQNDQFDQSRGERFWQGILNFRAVIEREGLVYTEDDFANLRDRTPGREIEL